MLYVLATDSYIVAKLLSVVALARIAAPLPEYLPKSDKFDEKPRELIEFERAYDETLEEIECYSLREELKARYARWVYDASSWWRGSKWDTERDLNRFAESLEQLLGEDEQRRAKRYHMVR